MSHQSNLFFATARPLRLFFMVALPGMVSMLAASLYSIIEGVVIGQILGEAAFAAVNLAMPFVFINFSLADLIGVGSAVPISIALGKKEPHAANNIFSCSLILIFSAGILMGALLYFTAPFLIAAVGAQGPLALLAVKYVRVFALLSPFTTIVFAIDNYLRICGFVKISMALNIFMSLLTAGLVTLFLGVFGWDVDGSALATCLSMSVCALLAFLPFLAKKTVLRFTRPRFTARMCAEIVACGAPVFLNNIAGRFAAILLNSALLRTGGQTAVAAYAVLMYAAGLVEPMLYGMSDATQPALGYNWGAGAYRRVRAIAKCVFVACGIVSLVGMALMLLFPAPIASLFVNVQDTALLSLSVHALRIFAVAFLFRWFGFAVQGFYSAIEKPLCASILSVCSALIFPILFLFTLTPLGLDGLWWNTAATSLCVALLALVLLLFTQKRMAKNGQR